MYESLLGAVAYCGSDELMNADILNFGLINLSSCILALLLFICSLRPGAFMIAGG